MTKIIEITGISGIGKTSWLHNTKSMTYDDIVSRSIFHIYFVIPARLLFFVFSGGVKVGNVLWLFKVSMGLNENFNIKINVFRNCLMKFLIQRDISNMKINNDVIFVDEGLSHIPFLIQNHPFSKKVISEYYLRFSKDLKKINVYCLLSDANTFERLKKRGHKRLINASDEKIHKFVKMNHSTLEIIKANYLVYLSYKNVNLDE